ncbi:MAG: hypothetical protein IPP63_16335 [Chloracidobacterium sp.]|nr:hypothetical protein [Chloracidobacterium sp.]
MAVYIGVDFHPYEQTLAFVDEADGEIRYKRFLHSDKAGIKAFYRKCGKDAVIGTEATGSLWWFEKLLFDNGMTLKIGDPRMIRRAALSRHKNDHRDGDDPGSIDARDISGDHAEERAEPRDARSAELSSLIGEQADIGGESAAGVRTIEGLATVPFAGGKGEKEDRGG